MQFWSEFFWTVFSNPDNQRLLAITCALVILTESNLCWLNLALLYIPYEDED